MTFFSLIFFIRHASILHLSSFIFCDRSAVLFLARFRFFWLTYDYMILYGYIGFIRFYTCHHNNMLWQNLPRICQGQMLSEFCSQDLVAFIREQREAVELPSTVQRDTVWGLNLLEFVIICLGSSVVPLGGSHKHPQTSTNHTSNGWISSIDHPMTSNDLRQICHGYSAAHNCLFHDPKYD